MFYFITMDNINKDTYTQIKITIGARERLKSLGRKGETYTAIIHRIIDKEEGKV